MAWSGWENFQMPEKPKGAAAPTLEKVPTDRGSNRGARRCVVTDDLRLLDHATAKAAGIKGVFFQSRKEAKRWIALQGMSRGGIVRNLARQVRFPLSVRNRDGLMQVIGNYVADFVFEERGATANDWIAVVEDVKPGGGLREDLYLWKRKHFEAEHGKVIREF